VPQDVGQRLLQHAEQRQFNIARQVRLVPFDVHAHRQTRGACVVHQRGDVGERGCAERRIAGQQAAVKAHPEFG
jgi:hypothetical protein